LSSLKLALIQFPRGPELEGNVELMADMVAEARADVKVLPENWASLKALSLQRLKRILAQLAERLRGGEVLVAGAFYVKRGGAAVSMGAVVSSSGVEALYGKKHPSRAVGEHTWLKPGRGPALFEAGGVKVGVLVCVDLMYPEEARGLALRGASVIVNPASISMDRVGLWRSVGVCRAADGRPVMGGSFAASPEGTLMLSADVEPGVYLAELDPSWVERVRAKWGFLDEVEGGAKPLRRRHCSQRASRGVLSHPDVIWGGWVSHVEEARGG
jgi:predicted amidohydrolase